jgi:arabinogalactan oligomer/maltooligosaccharide transport system permease protein
MNARISQTIWTLGLYVIILAVSVGIIYPVLWIVFSSFNSSQTMFSSTLIPRNFTLGNYFWLFFDESSKYKLWFMNTLKISSITMVIQVSVVFLIAYAFSRFKFRFKRMGLLMFMTLQILPVSSALIAFYALGILLGLVQKFPHEYLIAIYAGSGIPMNTYLVKGYLDTIPRELDDAAHIDGASNIRTLLQVILPLAKPIIAVQALWAFMIPAQDFILPSLIIRDPDKFTLAVGLQSLISGKNGGGAMEFTKFAAGSLLIAVPIALLFIILQRHLVSGLASGGTKG